MLKGPRTKDRLMLRTEHPLNHLTNVFYFFRDRVLSAAKLPV